MNNNRTELFAAWIVALALIAVMGFHAFLPSTPPRLGPGVTDASQPRPVISRDVAEPLAEPDLPAVDIGDPVLPPEERRGLAEPQRDSGSEPAAGRWRSMAKLRTGA